MKTRRNFLKTGFLGGASILLARAHNVLGQMGQRGRGMMGGMMNGGQPAVLDPPPGNPFKDPPVIADSKEQTGHVSIHLEAKVTPVNLGGTTANLLTYNGSYPGPTIKVRRGDHLRVTLKNSLSLLGNNLMGHDRDITNLHTHGLHVSPSGNSDNVMVIIKPGDAFTYDYDLSKQAPGSLNFYHPHIHGTVAEQFWGGLAGALEIADENDALNAYETHLLFLKDISLSGEQPEPYLSMMDYMHGKEGNRVMVNGQVNPVLTIKPGQVQRWEIINQSMMDHPFHQHVNPCQVLSITGGDADYSTLYTGAPAWKDVVVVPKMGSVRILVPVLDYDGTAMFHCHIVEHEDIGMMGLWQISREP